MWDSGNPVVAYNHVLGRRASSAPTRTCNQLLSNIIGKEKISISWMSPRWPLNTWKEQLKKGSTMGTINSSIGHASVSILLFGQTSVNANSINKNCLWMSSATVCKMQTSYIVHMIGILPMYFTDLCRPFFTIFGLILWFHITLQLCY
jgi:hypothetical protein